MSEHPAEKMDLSVPNTFELVQGKLEVIPKEWEGGVTGFELMVRGVTEIDQGLQLWKKGDQRGINFISSVRRSSCSLDEAKSLLEGLNFKDPAQKEAFLASIDLPSYA